MLAHVPSFGRNPRGSPDFLAYHVPKACMHVLGTRVPRRMDVARSASSPKAAQALGCSLTPGLWISFGRVTCMARAASVPGLWALGFLLLCGVGVWVRVAVGRGFRFHLPVVSCPPLFPVPLCVLGACVLCVLGPGLGCAPPFLAGLSGCVFCAFLFFWLCAVGCWGPCPGPCGPCPPIPFLSGWAAGSFFFVCLHVSVSLFQLGRCSWLGVAGFGWVFPLCLFGGPVFGAFWVGGLAASGGVGARFSGCGLFSRPPSPPSVLFVGGGGCLFLPLPFLGWRTHWPAFSVVFWAAVGGCVLFGRVPAPWVGWAMYTLGSAPLLVGLGPSSAGRAAAPGGCVWLWVRELGLFVSFPLCGAGFNLLGGPPPLLPGARWPRVWPAVPVCGVLVRRLPGCAVVCFG